MDLTLREVGLPGVQRGVKIPSIALDAYYVWATMSRFVSFGGVPDWFYVSFEMPVKGAREPDILAEIARVLRSPQVQLQVFWWKGNLAYGLAFATAAGTEALEDAAAAGQVLRFQAALVPSSASAGYPAPPLQPSSGKVQVPKCQAPVLYGMVDHGCPFTHPGLKLGTGSRVLGFWDQSGTFQIPGSGPPAIMNFGSAATGAAIDQHFGAAAAADDWAMYQAAGLPGLGRDASHGAHLLGCLFGAQANSTLLWEGTRDHVPVPQPPRDQGTRDLLFVQLPSSYLQGVPATVLDLHRLAGLFYILSRAGSATRRVIVPLSSENYDGSHDGQSFFAKALDAMVHFAWQHMKVELSVPISAGNCLRTNTHDVVELRPDRRSHLFPVRVLPGNVRETIIELWMPHQLDALRLELRAPRAAPLPFPSGDGYWTVVDALGRAVAEVTSLRYPTSAGPFQRRMLIVIHPTHPGGSAQLAGIAGDWGIGVSAAAEEHPPRGLVCAYIARSTPALGGRRVGYQSLFVRRYSRDWDFETKAPAGDRRPFDAFSISGLATVDSAQVGGAYRIRRGQRALYSAGGPARVPGRLQQFLVDFAAPGDQSRNIHGILGWGNRRAGFVRLSGTSLAPPFAARVLGRLGPPLPTTNPGTGFEDPQIAIAQILP